ncbi:ABC transporter permease [Parachryseolinea silvisoli]|jgi:putative ABC transport system permease protein|uniref:ABC transporter permease n=1 Tax=Parachryseolinea silvisoli TaxID=2873601 RepID=UPI002265C498|nr:ABC transporter permease [Parachryseolinea silvisoli]MCD9014288.1 ABC transporter permease [Parachryseolinea silvisoli]
MFRNYFLVAIRNMNKHKFFSAINIFGMTTGITACMLIFLYISDELSYDRFHARADHMYRVNLFGKISGQDIHTSTTCPPMAAALVAEIPEVEEATRIDAYGQSSIKYGDIAFIEDKMFYADSNFFQFFSYKLLLGDARTALKEPRSIVMTEDVAHKYFGEEPALGKMVVIGNENETFKVTGVCENAPTNSHLVFNVLLSASSADFLRKSMWLNNSLYTYLVLHKGASIEAVQAKLRGLAERHVGPEMERFLGKTMKQLEAEGGVFGYTTIAVPDIHLRSTMQHEIEPVGNLLYVYFFGGVGAFIIVIACINFMNLSTARSAGRAKEVGLRKTLGSLRGQLVRQFLSESLLYSAVAVIMALAACYLLLPSFNLLAGKTLQMELLYTPTFIASALALIVLVGFIAGSYPAFYLTSFSPVEVLKGKVRSGMRSKGVRSSLVVFQFALSIFLIIFTIVVYQQITFMQERNLGMDKHNLLIINNAWKLEKNQVSFKNTLLEQTGILDASFTNNNFPGVNNTTVFKASGSEQDHIMGVYYADVDNQRTMRFEMKEGRFFSPDSPADTLGIVLNEAAVKEFGFEKPLEEEILYNDNEDGLERLKVIGVYKDFNFESLRDKVRPLAIRFTRTAGRLMVRYEGDPTKAIATIEKLWKTQTENEPIQYSFMDQNFDRLFRSEQRMGQVFGVFSALAIFIACLGLFALAAFTAEQRTKEIGIRKAMGASMPSLIVLLSKEFTRLVLIAFVPAALAGWYIASNWLQGFEYRVEISPLIFVGSGLAAITIAWVTVGYQSIKAAGTNPVNSLRYE